MTHPDFAIELTNERRNWLDNAGIMYFADYPGYWFHRGKYYVMPVKENAGCIAVMDACTLGTVATFQRLRDALAFLRDVGAVAADSLGERITWPAHMTPSQVLLHVHAEMAHMLPHVQAAAARYGWPSETSVYGTRSMTL